MLSARLLTDICWSCLFPIRIAGAAMGPGSAPPGAARETFCSCPGPAGLPEPGLALGLWVPARLVELVRSPGCAPALGGLRLPLGARRLLGTLGRAEHDTSETRFYSYHYYAFPLLALLDLLAAPRCGATDTADFDLLYLSELDPTWSNEELAFFTHPEAAWLAGPSASAACVADGIAATAGRPEDAAFWCAGSWGHLYPLTGVDASYGSLPRTTSLLATRVLAALHRRGLARRTVGSAALCEAPLETLLPKSQYRMSMLYPVAETERSHAIGQNVFTWGESRVIPGPGEDQLYVIWRWTDCCATF